MIFLTLKGIKLLFFSGETLRVFHHCFFRCFHFSSLFFGCFHCWLHFFMSTTFLYPNCFFAAFLPGNSFLCCCTVNVTVWASFFTLRCFLTYTPFPHFPQYPDCYGFDSRHFLTYTPSRHLTQRDVAPTCFQGLPGSRLFFFEVAGLPNCGSNRSSPSFSLNHILFNKKYYSMGSICV